MQGLAHHLFRIPVQAGEIVAVLDKGCRLKVATVEGHNDSHTVEVALSWGMAQLKRPKRGDYLIEYPHGHIDIMDAVAFAAKAASGGADVQ